MKKFLTSLNIFLCIMIFFSCSSSPYGENKSVKTHHSEETNRAFSMIENNGSYRRETQAIKNSTPPPRLEKVGRPVPSTSNLNFKENKHSLPESVMIEINQNLAFYCMQHRKSRRFGGNEEKCMAFVNKTLEDCQQKSASTHHKLLKCLKAELKKRS